MAKKVSGLARAHIKVYGKVQDVGFRFYVNRRAAAAGLTGWICNCDGDAVEIVFQGDRKKIEHCIEECRHGPRFSKVERIEVEWQKPLPEHNHFEVR